MCLLCRNGRIYNTTFINNSDNAVYLSTNNNLDVINCYFLNHVITKGSLFYISSGNVLLYNSTFKNNQMKNQYLVYSYNGGIIDSCILKIILLFVVELFTVMVIRILFKYVIQFLEIM